MFARNVRMQLKPNSTAQFTQTLEKEILPVLRKQEGFQDEVTFIVPNGNEAIAISFWQTKENAEAYALCLSESAEGAEQGRRGDAPASDVRGLQLDLPQDRRAKA